MRDSNFLRENNAQGNWHPMAHPADMRTNAPTIFTHAHGVRITDIDGHETVDAVGGLWNVNLGFSCAPIKAAIAEQMEVLPYYSTFRGMSNPPAIELGWALNQFFAADGMVRAFFTSGGSDSVETALRLARQYHKLHGEPGRTGFFSLKKGYHGTHFGGASVNGNTQFRHAYAPLLPDCNLLPAPYTYRNPFDEADPERLADLIVKSFEADLAFVGAHTVAALIMEPILGAGGVIPPHPSLMPRLTEICRKHGILVIADEVITGFGRSGAESGSRLWGVQPDFMCLAKAITNGYFPFGAVMIGKAVADVFEDDRSAMGSIGHGYTYSGHPVGAAAALACLAETERVKPHLNAAKMGKLLHEGLLDLVQEHAIIGDVRGGHGLMAAIELVSDRSTKTPADKATVAAVHKATYENRAMVRTSGNNIILSPPLILTESDVGTILSALDAGLGEAAFT